MIDVIFRDLSTSDGRQVGLQARTADDVEVVIDALAQPKSASGMVTHDGRELWEGKYPDHELVVVIDGALDLGALCYWDRDTPRARTLGPGDGPDFEDENVDFPPDSWLPRAQITEALAEFVTTGNRPTCVSWQVIPQTW
ncbi:Imm1 family immunity protein [Allokutzneria oryzae]|uniref:Imm1 family immunity protein n=1 Tax=Allokutzneria oryzae TaxID=1378989 RepID=A0ABV5ZZN9_9PSEU